VWNRSDFWVLFHGGTTFSRFGLKDTVVECILDCDAHTLTVLVANSEQPAAVFRDLPAGRTFCPVMCGEGGCTVRVELM